MSLFHKECELCGTQINKLQSWWNLYALKAGRKLKCPKCKTEYKTNKFISFLGQVYAFFGPLIAIFFIVSFLDSFRLKLGGEVWLYAFIIYSVIELMVMVILPLKKIENKEQGEKNGN